MKKLILGFNLVMNVAIKILIVTSLYQATMLMAQINYNNLNYLVVQ